MARVLHIVCDQVFDFCFRHRHWTLVSSLLIVLAASVAATKIHVELNLYDHEMQGFPTTRSYQEEKHRFLDANSVILLFYSQTGSLTYADACQIHDWIQNQQRTKREIVSATTGFSLRKAKVEDEKMWYRKVLPPPCSQTDQQSAQIELSQFQQSPWRMILTNQNGTDIGAEFVFRDTLGASRFGKFDPQPIRTLLQDAAQDLLPKVRNLKIAMVGPSAFSLHLKEALAIDMFLQSLVFVIIFLFFRWAFGTWKAGLIYLGSIAIDLVIVYGSMALVHQPLDLLTNNLILMTAISGLEDFLFVSVYMKITRRGWHESLRAMALPCFFTTFTTMLGFLSLQTAGIDMIGRFGLWAAWAALIEWCVMFLLLPSLCEAVPWFRSWLSWDHMKSMKWIHKMAALKASPWMVYASVPFFIAGLVGFKFLNINERPTQNFSSHHMNSESYSYLLKSRGWEGALSLIFESPDLNARKEEVTAILEKLRQHSIVADILNPFSVADFISRDLPEGRWTDIVNNEFSATPAYRRLFSGRDAARAVVYLRTADVQSLRTVETEITRLCPDRFCRIAGQSAVYMEFSKRIIPTLLESFVTSLILVLLTIGFFAWVFGIQNKLAVIYSCIWGPVTMMGVIALFQIPVSLITSLFAAIIVGMTGDNSIQYIFASCGQSLEDGIEERAEASVFLSVMLAVCSVVFVCESVKPMQILGLLFMVGFFVNLVGDLWLLKACNALVGSRRPSAVNA